MEKSLYEADDEAAAAADLTEMLCLKRQGGQSSEDAAMKLCLGRRQLLLPSSSDSTLDATSHIKVGCFYAIDHSKLPSKTPDQLMLVRVIMVSKKSKFSVSLRYPSVYSLRAHFSERNHRKLDAKMLPSLDEQYAMGSELAGEVLYRKIPQHEIAAQRNQWNFWMVASYGEEETGKTASRTPSPAIVTSYVNVDSKKGLCWSELKSTGMIRWGLRRRVRSLGCHVEEEWKHNLSRSIEGEENKGNEEEEEEEDEEEADDEEVEEEIMMSDKENMETDTRSSKRKVHEASKSLEKPKKAKYDEHKQEIILYNSSKRKEVKNSIERWSAPRYRLAEENMLKIMKEKRAAFGNPILRPALRTEARKLIGDTGLLDHLLKHMAGKVAPGGKERFMRRHNANGAMEYWLESADLMDIRKEAGVQDPYWTPPPGWKPGDNPTLDPVCAKELNELREEIAKLKKDMLESKNLDQEDPAFVTTPRSTVASQKYLVHDNTTLLPLKDSYVDLTSMKAKLEGKLEEIAQSLFGLKEEMGKLKSMVESMIKPESAETTLLIMGSTKPPLGTEIEAKEMEKSNKDALLISDEEGKDSNAAFPRARRNAMATTEDKVAVMERPKSGFRMCKPQGTFLWPNMALSRKVVVPIEDLLAIPTASSVGSSTTTAPRVVSSPAVHGSQPTSISPPPLETASAQHGKSSITHNHIDLNESGKGI